MKLLLTTLLLISVAFGPRTESESTPIILSESFETPAPFGFGESFYLDINKDGVDDFQFTTVMMNQGDVIHTKYLVNPLGNNALLAVEESAAINETGVNIQSLGNEQWSKGSGEIIEQVIAGNDSHWSGTWSGDREQYIGIQLMQNGKTYHGWVNVSIDPDNERAYVIGFALNRMANGEIAAGQI